MTLKADEGISGPDSDDDPAVFDGHGTLDRCGGDRIFLCQVVLWFLEDAPRQVLRLRSAHAEQDWPEAERVAHSLRGASSNVGATGAVRAAARLENAARNCSAAECARLLGDLEAALTLFRRAVSRTGYAAPNGGAVKEDCS